MPPRRGDAALRPNVGDDRRDQPRCAPFANHALRAQHDHSVLERQLLQDIALGQARAGRVLAITANGAAIEQRDVGAGPPPDPRMSTRGAMMRRASGPSPLSLELRFRVALAEGEERPEQRGRCKAERHTDGDGGAG
jgi:hypothetical protein